MASSQFRDSLASMGWSRREADTPVSTQSKPLLGRLFGGSGGVRLPTAEPSGAPLPAPSRREEEEAWFARKPFLRKAYTPRFMLLIWFVHSKSMGSSARLWGLQSIRSRMFCDMFLPLASCGDQTKKVCHPVSQHSPLLDISQPSSITPTPDSM